MTDSAAEESPAPTAFAVSVALALVYVLWGSTAPAIRVAVMTVPPFAMVAIRFGIAGALLWAWSRFRGTPLPNAREWRGAALTGIALLVASNGVFAWVEQYVPSGVGSIFFALAPLWMALAGQFTLAASLAIVFLVIFGSIVGFSAFLWLMNNVSTTLASTYAYVNPIVAISIGVVLLHERFDWHLAMGAAIILAGVAAMIVGRAKKVPSF